MIDISIKNLKKAYDDGVDLFDGLSFDVQAGEHIGILGRNGCGKTTLFRILSGETGWDEGSVTVAGGKRLGLISQIPVYPPEYSTDDVLKTANRRVDAIAARMEALTERMASDASPEVLREYDRLSAEFERLGGWDVDHMRDRVANGLEIPPEMRQRLFSQLSGGEKTRVNLARLILEDTDILLLDEPTNHLDLHATEWLEDYVLRFHGTVLAISHDRWFLDTVAQRCIEIDEGKAEFYAGNYSFYVTERQHRFAEKLKKYEKDQAKYEQLKKAAEQMHLWAFMGNDKLHKRAFSMEKRMEKLNASEKPHVQKKMSVRFAERDFFGDEVLVVEGVGKRFGEKQLFHDLELLVQGGERIALLGDNGAGKSTFLKIIMEEELPDTGWVHLGPSVKTAYLPQIIRFDHPERTLYDTMLYEEKCTPQQARDRLAQFQFTGEEVFKPVSALSGGELSRLRLCMLMRHDINFLILDEPTNHLDIASREWIEDAVADYGGALLFVSHDRWFIERFANRIWELRDGEITDYKGSFSQFREYRERQQSIALAAAHREEKTKAEKPQKKNAPSHGRKLALIEREIEKTEQRVAALEAEAEANASDYQKLMELEERKAALNTELEGLYAQWEALSEA
ncbi:MAG: ABC-F family ATP-binding cassette domain-containing protein [Oscillospiraceae bacterium]|nr:ABC-F family ATP-binding cassette domain-containing protein [Oscillospiraceae bacterium]